VSKKLAKRTFSFFDHCRKGFLSIFLWAAVKECGTKEKFGKEK